jgi:hypothetical protein
MWFATIWTRGRYSIVRYCTGRKRKERKGEEDWGTMNEPGSAPIHAIDFCPESSMMRRLRYTFFPPFQPKTDKMARLIS